jgi:hypothetical protein
MSTLNPRSLSDKELESEVKKAAKGSESARDAYLRIKNAFSPPPLLWVNEKGACHFEVFIQPFPHAEHHSIICDRL